MRTASGTRPRTSEPRPGSPGPRGVPGPTRRGSRAADAGRRPVRHTGRMEHLHDDVIRKVDDGDVRFIRLWFCDIAGTLKSIAISPSDLEVAFTEGIGIDGSTIEGLTRSYESDKIGRESGRER